MVSCLGWLVSLSWSLYEYEYVMSWLWMLKSLSIECMNDMWPHMKLRGSFMWNLEPGGKVMNVEVVSRNGILQSKGIMDLILIGWNDIILIFRKVMMSFLSPLWGNPSRPFFGRVNVIGLWTCYGTLLCEPLMWINLWEWS